MIVPIILLILMLKNKLNEGLASDGFSVAPEEVEKLIKSLNDFDELLKRDDVLLNLLAATLNEKR
jgi:hypothetical protein